MTWRAPSIPSPTPFSKKNSKCSAAYWIALDECDAENGCMYVHTRRLRFETRWLRHFFSPTATLAFVLWRYCFDHTLMLIDGCNRHDGCCCTGTWLRARTWREHQTTACQINVQMGAQWKRIQRGIFFTLQRISQATKRPILSRCNLEMR